MHEVFQKSEKVQKSALRKIDLKYIKGIQDTFKKNYLLS